MNYLVDTNVLSEPARKSPAPAVVEWLRTNETGLYVSAVSIGELRRGIERLPRGRRRDELQDWLTALCSCMQGRILSFNASIAHVWGQLKAKWDASGFVLASLDSQIAATAHRHNLTLVTRNERHFLNSGVRLLNPFSSSNP